MLLAPLSSDHSTLRAAFKYTVIKPSNIPKLYCIFYFKLYHPKMSGYDSADLAEKGATAVNSSHHLERLTTAGGHPNDRTQPALPVVHRSFANPAPLGLLSFATGRTCSGEIPTHLDTDKNQVSSSYRYMALTLGALPHPMYLSVW
jgi:hypothetical protein